MVTKSACVNALLKVRYKWNEHPYFRLFAYIVATSLVLYWQFIFGDKTFVFFDSVGGDQSHAYIPIYNFFANTLKDGSLPSYTFQYGFGNSIFSLIGYITDPFSIIGVMVGLLFGTQYIADSMIYILILKHVCSGLLCLYFLKEFHFTAKSCMISAYIYSFSGYIMTLGEHYFLAVSPVYFILFLIMLEKTIKGEHKIKVWLGLFAVAALISANSLVTAYEMFIGAGFYILLRVIYIYGNNKKIIIQKLGICLAFVVGGLLVSSFILFPFMEKVAGSDRLIHNNDYFWFNEAENIKSALLKLFSNNLEGTPAAWYGGVGAGSFYSNCFPCFFSVMLLPMAAQYVWRNLNDKSSIRQKIFKMIPVLIVLFAIIDKFIPYMFSCFVPSSYHSYVYVFLPLYAILIADVIDNIKEGKFNRKVNYLIMIVSLTVIVWGGISSYYEGNTMGVIWMVFPSILLAAGCFAMDIIFLSYGESVHSISIKEIKNVSCAALFAVIIINLFGENYMTVNYGRGPVSKTQERSSMLITNVADSINTSEENNFFRFETTYYDGIMMNYTYPLLFPIRSTGYYDSSLDNDVPEFYLKMFNYSNHNMIDYYNGCASFRNTIIEDILGIKYLLSSSELQRSGWEKIEEYPEEKAYLYRNTDIDSAGLFFDSYITQDEADEMSFNERALGMATRLIVDEPSSYDLDNYAIKYSVDNNEYHNDKAIAVNFDSVQPFNGTIDSFSQTGESYNIKATLDGDGSNITFSLNTDILNNSKNAVQIKFKLKDNRALKNFVYCDNSDNTWKEIPNLMPQTDNGENVYTFIIPQTAFGLALCVNQSCELDVTVSSKTVASTYINEGIKLDNPKRGNTVTGTVNAQKNSLLYLPIPFDKYWNAYIDGEKVDIMKANYAFMAVPVTAGQHSVTFIYSNKTYHTFRKVSIAAFILYNGFFAFCFIVKYRRKKKGEKK